MAMGSRFGDLFRISTFGESHGGGVGVIVEGCPPRLNLSVESIQAELDRRKPGQSHITTPRKEADQVEILSAPKVFSPVSESTFCPFLFWITNFLNSLLSKLCSFTIF